jgi:hypothetical protein
MRKILVIGFVPYGYDKKLSEKNPDVIFFQERSIAYSGGVNSIIELVDMVNGVLFMEEESGERLAWEVACIMKNKRIFEKSDFPVEDEKESEGDDAN